MGPKKVRIKSGKVNTEIVYIEDAREQFVNLLAHGNTAKEDVTYMHIFRHRLKLMTVCRHDLL